MMWLLSAILLSVSLAGQSTRADDDTSRSQRPDVLVTILASNEEHLLPIFFGGFERLNYPKENIGLWIRSDHNLDDTPHFLDVWLENNAALYHSVSVDIRMLPQEHEDNPTKHNWPTSRYQTLIRHKEGALSYAREKQIPFVFFLDTDALITNEDILQDLMAENQTVIAPLLQSMSAYSNFWGEMDNKGYYLRSKTYLDIVERQLIGTHPAALVHSAVLVDLNGKRSDELTFRREVIDPALEKKLPVDDIIVFARSAQKAEIGQFVTNKKIHGWILPSTESVNMERQELVNLKVDVTHKGQPLPESESLRRLARQPVKDSLSVDQVYLINLERRRDRRDRMKYCFSELGIRFRYMPAVDGKAISVEMRESLGIAQLPEYRDPHKDRNLTLGEVGCFLSHYNIWKDMLEQGYREAIIFEDDIHFEPNFRHRVAQTLKAIRDQGHLELVYFGRKRLANSSEPYLKDTEHLVQVDYSYWTLSYYLTRRGAQKLIDGEPLSKMVPVDEYIPIMFDRHPRYEWKNAFQPRTLRAASAYPLLVYPTHYTGEEDYFSDTEDSPLVEEMLDQATNGIRTGSAATHILKEEL